MEKFIVNTLTVLVGLALFGGTGYLLIAFAEATLSFYLWSIFSRLLLVVWVAIIALVSVNVTFFEKKHDH